MAPQAYSRPTGPVTAGALDAGQGVSGSELDAARARLAVTAPARMSTPPPTTPALIGSSRNRNAGTVADRGSVAATIAVRTGPRRRRPANRHTNAPAVAAPIPNSGPHWRRPRGTSAWPEARAKTARASDANRLTHLAPASASVPRRTRSAPRR